MADIRKTVLSNGLTIVTEVMPAVRSVAVGIWLRGGSRQEREDENGITHFLEHMLFKGTEHRSAEEIARAADSIGGHLDAFTAKECTSFSIKVLDEHLPRGFEILSDLVKNPLFQAEDITKESQVVREEIKMVEDTPDDLVHEIYAQTYWPGHGLGRPILGTRQTVGSFDRKRLMEYFHGHYAPNALVISAAGNLQHQQIVDLVEKEFGGLQGGPEINYGAAPVAHPHLQLRRKKQLEQVHICMGAPAYPQSHERRFACYILNAVLGGGMSSRLFQNIREKRGLVYSVFSSFSPYRDVGSLTVYAATSSETSRQVVGLIIEEFCRLKSEPITAEDIQRAKDYLKGSLLLGLESTPSRMSNLARQEMYFGRHVSIDEIARAVDAVTTDDVQTVARELLVPDQIACTVLGPPNGLKLSRSDLAC